MQRPQDRGWSGRGRGTGRIAGSQDTLDEHWEGQGLVVEPAVAKRDYHRPGYAIARSIIPNPSFAILNTMLLGFLSPALLLQSLRKRHKILKSVSKGHVFESS